MLDCDRAALLAYPERPVASDDAERYRALLERRSRGEPIQHLTGEAHFWGRTFAVGPGALIPRPETEGLVEAALQRLEGIPQPLVADVGTGTGCIALSIAAEREDARIHAIDRSWAALELAARNRRRLALEARVALHHGDLLAPLAGLGASLDLVASNPPYIDRSEAPGLAAEVRAHEPAAALFPTGDRLAVYRRLLPAARRSLRPGRWLVVEIGAGMEDDVAALVAASGLVLVEVLEDLQRIPRVVVARRGERG